MSIEDSIYKYSPILNPLGSVNPQEKNKASSSQNQPTQSFKDVLQKNLETVELNFSKHAQQRLEQRDIELTQEDLQKLNNAVKKAGAKGVENPLILSSKGAFIVNVPNNTVITAMGEEDLKENVFTQIDGAVII